MRVTLAFPISNAPHLESLDLLDFSQKNCGKQTQRQFTASTTVAIRSWARKAQNYVYLMSRTSFGLAKS